jgi:hypothetical protein
MSLPERFIETYWENWIASEFVPNSQFKSQLEDYMTEHKVTSAYRPTYQQLNTALKSYAKKKGFKVLTDHIKHVNKQVMKGRYFFPSEYVIDQQQEPTLLFSAKLSDISLQFSNGNLRVFKVE